MPDTYRPATRRNSVNMVYDSKLKRWVNATGAKPKDGPSTGKPTLKEPDEDGYIEEEFNVLQGEVSIVPTSKTIRIRVNDTVTLEGVGKHLSGKYYVSTVKRTINSSGYSHTMTLLKHDFTDSLKDSPYNTRKDKIEKDTGPFKFGDKVKIVGANAIYSNAHQGYKVPAWVKKRTHTIDAVSKDKKRVRLLEIWSWTYVKYIKKV